MGGPAGRAEFESLKTEAARLRTENERLEQQARQLVKEIQELKGRGAQAQAREISDRLLSEKTVENGVANLMSRVDGLEGHQPLRMLSDSIRQKEKVSVIFLSDAQGNCVVSCSEDAQKSGIGADALLRMAAEVAGGSGGGRPGMAQGRLKDPARFHEVRDRLRRYIRDLSP